MIEALITLNRLARLLRVLANRLDNYTEALQEQVLAGGRRPDRRAVYSIIQEVN